MDRIVLFLVNVGAVGAFCVQVFLLPLVWVSARAGSLERAAAAFCGRRLLARRAAEGERRRLRLRAQLVEADRVRRLGWLRAAQGMLDAEVHDASGSLEIARRSRAWRVEILRAHVEGWRVACGSPAEIAGYEFARSGPEGARRVLDGLARMSRGEFEGAGAPVFDRAEIPAAAGVSSPRPAAHIRQ